MRKLRVVISGMGTAMPTLVATLIAPAVDCGSTGLVVDASADATLDGKTSDAAADSPVFPPIDASDAGPGEASPCPMGECTYVVPIPDAGVFPDLASVCAVGSPVVSNTAALLTLTSYDPNAQTADGFVAIPQSLLDAMVGDPVIAMVVGNPIGVQSLTKTTGGYSFKASSLVFNGSVMTAKVTLQIACGDAGLDGGIQTVESMTDLALCGVDGPPQWESSGGTCIQCCVVCEMAPTPIVSDNHGDDLPLGRALRLRVLEVARAGNRVVLFAQNDAGGAAEYDWRVFGGTIERLADDVVVWTLPDDVEARAPFGQLAVWNDEGATVENFYWGAAA
jgi:hypothetical protein